MKALTVLQPWASAIAIGNKRIEHRSWPTQYRGKLLICSGAKRCIDDIGLYAPGGFALCTVEISDVRQNKNGSFSWVLKNRVEIIPFKVKGKQRLFEITPPAEIEPLPKTFETHLDFILEHYPELNGQ